jgi:hypothetical protein
MLVDGRGSCVRDRAGLAASPALATGGASIAECFRHETRSYALAIWSESDV